MSITPKGLKLLLAGLLVMVAGYILMTGGGSLIYGMDRLIERSTGIRTVVADDAVSCAVYGAGKMLMHLDDMQDGMMNFYRKRQLKG